MPAHCENSVKIQKPPLEVADIFRQFGVEYIRTHRIPLYHLKVVRAIELCRTSALGGHIERCDRCGFEMQAFNSCRNRHCPKCQALTKAKWLEERKAELLPTTYFHNVFTLPHEINPIAITNKKIIYEMLFSAVSETLTEFGKDPEQGLGGKIGFTAILHTWDQKLLDHFHLHCLIPGGALSFDKQKWIPAKEGFLFDVKELSKAFREKFIHLLKEAYKKKELFFPDHIAHLVQEEGFEELISKLWQKSWVVYSKDSFVDPEYVLDYLGRYTHRVAISNNRLISIENDSVTFTYKDRKDEGKIKPTTISANEFIRRFLLHILPLRFTRIRYFGFLSNRYKKENIKRCQDLLDLPAQPPQSNQKTLPEVMLELCGLDITSCPACGQGKMIVSEIIPPTFIIYRTRYNLKPKYQDSS